jgi:hypothetical protein
MNVGISDRRDVYGYIKKNGCWNERSLGRDSTGGGLGIDEAVGRALSDGTVTWLGIDGTSGMLIDSGTLTGAG